MKENSQEKVVTKRKKWPLVTIIVLVILLAVAYFGFAAYYSSHFIHGAKVYGISASGATVEEVKAAIHEAASDYSLDIYRREKVEDTITADQISLVANPDDGEIESFLKAQNAFAWPAKLFNPDQFGGEGIVSFDEAELQRRVRTLNCVMKPASQKSLNATSQLDGDRFVVKKEVYGNEIDPVDLADKLSVLIGRLAPTADLHADHLFKEPDIRSDSPELKSLIDKLNGIADIRIEYEAGETIPRSQIASWIILDSNNEIRYDLDRIKSYVKELGDKYNTFGKEKELKTSFGDVVTVPGGTYGWLIDDEKEVEAIVADLKAGANTSREFEYKYTANSHEENDYGDSYIEVNISAQKLFFYKDGELVLETPFVSGNLARGMGTHVGAYKIAYCQRNAILRGQGYASPVSFWMPFNNGEGLHDATWRGSFGGNIYRTSGSHGCVNLPYSSAKTIFENVQAGYPVLVYADEGYNPGSPVAMPPEITSASVMSQISSLGEITLNSEAAIAKARADYNGLPDSEKANVTNIDALIAAEVTLASLKSGETVPGTEGTEGGNASVDSVMNSIGGIGAITLQSEGAINAARAAYNALPEDQKALVTNINVLIQAEQALANLKTQIPDPGTETVPEIGEDDTQGDTTVDDITEEIP